MAAVQDKIAMQRKRSIETLETLSIESLMNEILLPCSTKTHHHGIIDKQWREIITINKQKVIDFVFYHETNFMDHQQPYEYIPIPLHLLSLVDAAPNKAHKTLLIKNITEFVHQPSGKQYRQKRIKIGLFEFVLHLYPNGLTQTNNGFVAYFMEITKMALNVQYIVLYVHLFCAQTNTKHKETVILRQEGDCDGWILSLCTQHCKKHEFLQFGAELEILQIVYHSNTNLAIGHYVSSDLMLEEGMKYEYEWKWNELQHILHGIKQTQQKILFLTENTNDDAFCFGIEYDPQNGGNVWVHCKLLQLPSYLDQVPVCIEFEMNYKASFIFSYQHNDCCIKLTHDDMDWLLSSQDDHDLSLKISLKIVDEFNANRIHVPHRHMDLYHEHCSAPPAEWDAIIQKEYILKKEQKHLLLMQNKNKEKQYQINVEKKILNGELCQINEIIKELETRKLRLEHKQNELDTKQNEVYALNIDIGQKEKRLVAQQNECRAKKEEIKRQRKKEARDQKRKQVRNIHMQREIKHLVEMKREEKLMGIAPVNDDDVDITEMDDDDISLVIHQMNEMMDKELEELSNSVFSLSLHSLWDGNHKIDNAAASWICGRCQFLNQISNDDDNECGLCGHQNIITDDDENASFVSDLEAGSDINQTIDTASEQEIFTSEDGNESSSSVNSMHCHTTDASATRTPSACQNVEHKVAPLLQPQPKIAQSKDIQEAKRELQSIQCNNQPMKQKENRKVPTYAQQVNISQRSSNTMKATKDVNKAETLLVRKGNEAMSFVHEAAPYTTNNKAIHDAKHKKQRISHNHLANVIDSKPKATANRKQRKKNRKKKQRQNETKIARKKKMKNVNQATPKDKVSTCVLKESKHISYSKDIDKQKPCEPQKEDGIQTSCSTTKTMEVNNVEHKKEVISIHSKPKDTNNKKQQREKKNRKKHRHNGTKSVRKKKTKNAHEEPLKETTSNEIITAQSKGIHEVQEEHSQCTKEAAHIQEKENQIDCEPMKVTKDENEHETEPNKTAPNKEEGINNSKIKNRNKKKQREKRKTKKKRPNSNKTPYKKKTKNLDQETPKAEELQVAVVNDDNPYTSLVIANRKDPTLDSPAKIEKKLNEVVDQTRSFLKSGCDFDTLSRSTAVMSLIENMPPMDPVNIKKKKVSKNIPADTTCVIEHEVQSNDSTPWDIEARIFYHNAETQYKDLWMRDSYRIFYKEREEWLINYETDAPHVHVVREYFRTEIDCCKHMHIIRKAHFAFADRDEVILNGTERDRARAALDAVGKTFAFIRKELRSFIKTKGAHALPSEFVMIIINLEALQEDMSMYLKCINKLHEVAEDRWKRTKFAEDRRKAKHIHRLLRESPRIQNQKRKLQKEMKHCDDILQTIQKHKDHRAISRLVAEAKKGKATRHVIPLSHGDTFHICDDDMSTFLNTNPGTEYVTREYIVQHFKFNVQIFPNGSEQNNKGYVQFMVKWLETPAVTKSVVLHFKLLEKSTNAEYRSTKRWNVPLLLNTNIQWHSDLLSLQSCSEHKQLQFEFVVDILETCRMDDMLVNYCKGVKLSKGNEWSWAIDNALVLRIKQCIEMKQHRVFYVQRSKHEEMCLVLETMPNEESKQQLNISMYIFKLPPTIQRMELLFEIIASNVNGRATNKIRREEKHIFGYDACQCVIPFTGKQIEWLLSGEAFTLNIKVNVFRLWFKDYLRTPYIYQPNKEESTNNKIQTIKTIRDKWITPMNHGRNSRKKKKKYRHKKNGNKIKKKEKKTNKMQLVKHEIMDEKKQKAKEAEFKRKFNISLAVLAAKNEGMLSEMEKAFEKDKKAAEQELNYIHSLFCDSSDSDDTSYNKHHKCKHCCLCLK